MSGLDEDHAILADILRGSKWRLVASRSCQEAAELLQQNNPPVIICERQLPDGTWMDLLPESTGGGVAPGLIVTSRAADDNLWAEVLNLGGCDVLAKPFDATEVLWAVEMAWNEWHTRAARRRAEATAV